jgi:hypothetical protein
MSRLNQQSDDYDTPLGQSPFPARAKAHFRRLRGRTSGSRSACATFAYVTIGGLNEVKVFRTDDLTAGTDSGAGRGQLIDAPAFHAPQILPPRSTWQR